MSDNCDHDELPRPLDANAILAALKSLASALPSGPADAKGLAAPKNRALRFEIEKVIVALRRLDRDLDPIQMPDYVLNPADPDVVGRLIAETLLLQRRHTLASVPKFWGSGVYALYYAPNNDAQVFDAYAPAAHTETPLYVGKVDPLTHGATNPVEQGTKLFNRLNGDHKRSIGQARNLDVADFECRYLVVTSAWQVTAENYLIRRFHPVWNDEVGICYGIGKHGDAASTRTNTRSPWDTLHPGRSWATAEGNVPNPMSPDEIKALIAAHYKENPPV